ncbi:hypothetical protein A2U01_0112145, partial [Trifolium medium]|nr:hypothetical protein [Trifolium medium]
GMKQGVDGEGGGGGGGRTGGGGCRGKANGRKEDKKKNGGGKLSSGEGKGVTGLVEKEKGRFRDKTR